MTAPRRFFRYLALALAAVQIVAFAGAPVLEGARAASQTEFGVVTDPGDSERGVPRHDPGTCVVCQLISVVAALPVPPTVPAPVGETRTIEHPAADLPRQHVLLQGTLSRAPPTLPA